MLDLDKYKVSIEDLKCKNALDNIDFKTTEEITPVICVPWPFSSVESSLTKLIDPLIEMFLTPVLFLLFC